MIGKILRSLLLLPLCGGGVLFAQARVSATATLTVSGAEQTVGGKPDAGNIVVSFNGFVEAVHYGQYSTPASLASGLAASLTRDFNEFGLFAHAGTVVNGTETNATVITLQLTDGNRFGPVNWTMPSTSFSLNETGFAAGSGSLPADSGTVTLSVNSATISTTNYTAGSTPSSIAAGLVSSASSGLVTLRSDGDQLYINATTSGSGADYPYSVSITHDSTDFSTPSFTISPTSGSLASTGANTTTNIYSYGVTNPNGGPGYDVAGNVLYLTNDTVMGSWAYSYDGMNRLVAGKASSGLYVSNSLPDLCWSYDGYGNRTHESFSNQPFVNAVGSPCQAASGATLKDTVANYTGTPNRITTSTSPYASGTVTYTYDGDGDVTGDGVNTYLYDAEDRLCAVHGAGGMTGYQYDADGKRVGKGSITSMSCDITSNGYAPESDYVLDLGGNQMTEISVVTPSSPVWVHTNVMADGVLIATYDTTGSGLHFYLNDPLGTRRAQTNAAGEFEQTCQSLPYGDQLNCSLSTTAPTEHHFTGKERDAESGLDYFGARYYASNMGRWMSPDWSAKEEPVPYAKLDDPQSLNLYGYVLNNPLSHIDADGHQCDWCTAFGRGLGNSTLVPLWYLVHHPINTVTAAAGALRHPGVMAASAVNTVNAAAHGDGYAAGQVAGFGISAYMLRGGSGAAAATGGGMTAEAMAALAEKAVASAPEGANAAITGTFAHTAFAAEIRALGDSGVNAEVSYLNGEVVPYGTKGSVRLDAVVGPLDAPTAVYDLKTGASGLTASRINQIRANLPSGSSDIPVTELRPK